LEDEMLTCTAASRQDTSAVGLRDASRSSLCIR